MAEQVMAANILFTYPLRLTYHNHETISENIVNIVTAPMPKNKQKQLNFILLHSIFYTDGTGDLPNSPQLS